VPYRTPLVPQGPLVLPGTYTVRLTVGGHSESQPFTVKMDPRVHVSMTDLQAQHSAEVAMAASLDALSKADLEAHSVSEQLTNPQNRAIAAQLASFNAALKTLLSGPNSNAEPGSDKAKDLRGIDEVTAEATQLYAELQQADAAPNTVLASACKHVEDEGREVLPGWEEFKQKQLPALNIDLQNAHRPAINLEKRPANMPGEGDED
jgi:hypothetical protein